MSQQVEFFFDYGSPFSYLADTQPHPHRRAGHQSTAAAAHREGRAPRNLWRADVFCRQRNVLG
jgi:hypothetical protein